MCPGANRLADVARTPHPATPCCEWLGQDADRAQAQSALALLVGGDDLDGDVAGCQIVLEPVEHAPAVDVGQIDVERDGVRRSDRVPAQSPMRRADVTIGLHADSRAPSPPGSWRSWDRFRRSAAPGHRRRCRLARRRTARPARSGAPRPATGAGFDCRGRESRPAISVPRANRLDRSVGLRQIERERAAAAGHAGQSNLTAQQLRQFAADRQAQARCRRTCGWCSHRPAGTPRR